MRFLIGFGEVEFQDFINQSGLTGAVLYHVWFHAIRSGRCSGYLLYATQHF